MSFNLHAQSALVDIRIKGTIVNALTKESVKATIKYESLPYGSRIGLFSGSAFQFRLTEFKQYILDISAEGFVPYQEILNITTSTPAVISKTIELRAGAMNNFISLDRITFGVGKANLSGSSRLELDKLVYLFHQNNNILIHLEGHSDFRGNARQNMKLSRHRVETVKQYLIEKGVPESRIKTSSYGGSQPLSKGNNASMKNRRVEVKVFNYYSN